MLVRTPAGVVAAVTALALLLAGCTGASGAPVPSDGPIRPGEPLYVSIGDSYAAGYQPSAQGSGATSTNGFAYQVAATGVDGPVRLVNFGCSGVTSTALVTDKGCVPGALGPGGRPYDGTTQAEAAEQFLRAHPDQVTLVTVVIGGNDIKPCVLAEDGAPRPDAMDCARRAAGAVRQNLADLLAGVRAAVGDRVRIVGLTYPDVFLGSYVSGGPAGRDVAAGSVPLFRDVLNPVLREEYAKAGARFVDITAETGAYGPVTDTVELAPYGVLPRPVAQVCTLTFVCQLGDPHPTTEGYRFIADRVLRAAA